LHTRVDNLPHASDNLIDSALHHLVNPRFSQQPPALNPFSIQSPRDNTGRCEDGVIEQLIDDIDSDAGLDIAPEGNDGGDDLGAGCRGGVTDGGEAIFRTLDVGEDMGEGFGADVAEGGDVGVG